MFTLGMENGDIAIDEKGQPTEIEGTKKLCQDIAEALNSKYDANKKFGGRLAGMEIIDENDAEREVYSILDRLIDLQDKASPSEKIKSIRDVQTLKQNCSVYAYLDIVSYDDEKISETFTVFGD